MAKFKTYSIASDTLNGLLNTAALDSQLKADPTIGSIFDGINRTQGSDSFTCHLLLERTTEIDTAMDAIVAAHDGAKLTDPVQKVEVEGQPPFAAKVLPNGKKLYGRAHGKAFTLTAGANTLDFDVPYAACKITGMEIVGGEIGDTLDFFILDDDSGTYSTIPNYMLNQFGFDVAVSKDFYKRESAYDADLYYNMCISIAYYSQTAKTVYINYILHEVKT